MEGIIYAIEQEMEEDDPRDIILSTLKSDSTSQSMSRESVFKNWKLIPSVCQGGADAIAEYVGQGIVKVVPLSAVTRLEFRE